MGRSEGFLLTLCVENIKSKNRHLEATRSGQRHFEGHPSPERQIAKGANQWHDKV